MNVQFNFDDESAVFEVLDDFFIAMLKRELSNSKEYLESAKAGSWLHEGDEKMYKRNIKACKALLDYYT